MRSPLLAATLVLVASAGARADEPSLADQIAQLRQRIDQLEEEQAEREGGTAKEPTFHIWGFMDAGLQKEWAGDHAFIQTILPSDATTFVVGNLNLYLEFRPSESWSAFTEVSLTNLPDGEDFTGTFGASYTRFSTTHYNVTDVSIGSTVRLGSIIIERAYIAWRQSDLLTIRAGELLTPFGIWNVDHGTPTLIAVILPQFIQKQTFPMQQIGLEVLGTYSLAPWELEYHVTLSNGRTPTQLDFTDDKAVGGRVVMRRRTGLPLAFGASFYLGRFSDQVRRNVSFIPYEAERTETVAYDELVVGADASADFGSLRLRAEAVIHRVVYDTGKRELLFDTPGVYFADRIEKNFYLLASYQLPWLGLEPFACVDLVWWPTILGDHIVTPSAGLNLHFTPEAQLKIQYQHAFFYNGVPAFGAGDNDIDFFASRLVLAF